MKSIFFPLRTESHVSTLDFPLSIGFLTFSKLDNCQRHYFRARPPLSKASNVSLIKPREKKTKTFFLKGEGDTEKRGQKKTFSTVFFWWLPLNHPLVLSNHFRRRTLQPVVILISAEPPHSKLYFSQQTSHISAWLSLHPNITTITAVIFYTITTSPMT